MFQRIIVPVDGSDFSWRAFGPAQAIARHVDAELEVVEVVTLPDDGGLAEQYVRERLEAIDGLDPSTVIVTVLTMGETIPSTLAEHLEAHEGALVVMSSVGRGRAAALIGSVAEELLGASFGPVVVVGPHVDVDAFDLTAPVVVPVDGSETSESALPLAATWGITFGARPWVITVAEPDDGPHGDVAESSYPARLARHLSEQSHHEVDFEVLHHRHPAEAITEFARDLPASMIVASTHGRTGLARMRAGSVAMAIVRHAPCPVVLVRPPHLQS